jgi:2-amino-4-hydroxy-6-hydroxymethyldihydropteridine diphosphokinase
VKKTVYLSLGSNLGERAAHMQAAISSLGKVGTVMAVSSFYETEPVGFDTPQPWFLNCALAIETDLMPRQFWAATHAIERSMGRKRGARPASRTIDIDILLFGNAVLCTPELVVPHPLLHARRFVLAPLAELAPELRHPVLKQSMRELLEALPGEHAAVRRLRP